MRRGDPPGIVQRTPEGTRQTGHCTARICSVVSSRWFISVQESTGTTNRKYWVCCVYAPVCSQNSERGISIEHMRPYRPYRSYSSESVLTAVRADWDFCEIVDCESNESKTHIVYAASDQPYR